MNTSSPSSLRSRCVQNVPVLSIHIPLTAHRLCLPTSKLTTHLLGCPKTTQREQGPLGRGETVV